MKLDNWPTRKPCFRLTITEDWLEPEYPVGSEVIMDPNSRKTISSSMCASNSISIPLLKCSPFTARPMGMTKTGISVNGAALKRYCILPR
jgi:hypothetical protein